MKHSPIFLSLFVLVASLMSGSSCFGTTVYVDPLEGSDDQDGSSAAPLLTIERAIQYVKTIDDPRCVVKLNPGIHVLRNRVNLEFDRDVTEIVIEASELPGDEGWTPEKMPVVISVCPKEGIERLGSANQVVGFHINQSNTTIRGLKFLGYSYPNCYYFPIAKTKEGVTGLLVEQCLFLGERDASHIQVAVLVDGNGTRVEHCVFQNVRNGVVFWRPADGSPKKGNRFCHNVVLGAYQSGIWTSAPDANLVFQNNIMVRCKHAWIKNEGNPAQYRVESSLFADNLHDYALWKPSGIGDPFEVEEISVSKTGQVELVPMLTIDDPLPINYLHPVPGSPGAYLKAGLFK